MVHPLSREQSRRIVEVLKSRGGCCRKNLLIVRNTEGLCIIFVNLFGSRTLASTINFGKWYN